jgi:hypothetical protein
MRSMGQEWAKGIINAYLAKGCNPRTGSKELTRYVRAIQKKLRKETDNDVQG